MASKNQHYSGILENHKCKNGSGKESKPKKSTTKIKKSKVADKSPLFVIDNIGGIEDLHKKLRDFKEFLINQGLNEDEIIEHLNLIDKDMKDKKYGLVWEDREEDVYEQAKKKFALLTEVEEKEIKTDDSKPTNLLIEGDNLESLLSLQYTHKGLINLIYIDPPYNTGNKDFRYNDRYVDKEDTWRHSSWLSFMHKRLLLAKDLLTDDGVIFISIDDNEFAQLKLLCDEVFGESNFVANIIWKSKTGGANDSKYIACDTEYILVYSKNIVNLSLNKDTLTTNDYKFEDDYVEARGRYKLKNLDMGSLSYSKTLDYPILAPDNTPIYAGGDYDRYIERTNGKYATKDWCWRWSKDKLDWGISNGYIEFKKVKGVWKVYTKQYELVDYNGLSVERTVPYRNVLDFTNTTKGMSEIKNIFDNRRVFSYPKPSNLLSYLINLVPNKNCLVLDFFAGSGTTGHAVMELNKEDGGNRQFILCTNNENNICEEVTYQRLNKVINGYTTPKGKVVDGLGGNLKYYKTAMIDKGETYNENKSKLVSNMNSLISIKENAFNLEVEEDSYVTYSSNSKSVLIYNDVHIDSNVINNCIDSLNKNRGNKELVVYLPLDDSSAIDNVVLPTYQDLGIRFELIPREYINQYKRLVDNRG